MLKAQWEKNAPKPVKKWYNDLDSCSQNAVLIGSATALVLSSVALIYKLSRKKATIEEYKENKPGELVQYEAGQHWITGSGEERKVKFSESGSASMTPMTVTQLFSEAVKKYPNHPALKVERNGCWQSLTYQQYYDEVMRCARAFIALGMEPYQTINIIGFNSPEWLIANLGAVAAGGNAAGIYATNQADACKYIVEHSQGVVVIVENEKQLEKFLSIRDELPSLKAIVQYTGKVPDHANTGWGNKKVYSWEEFMKLGDDNNLQSELDERIENQVPGKCCTLIYTSGTTGKPKAVMMSHDNLTWISKVTCDRIIDKVGTTDGEHIISYLPLSHIAAQIIDIYNALTMQLYLDVPTTVWFARPDWKTTMAQTLAHVRPTVFFAVPRVWEKFAEKVKAAGASTTGIKKKIAIWAKSKGLKGEMALQTGGSGYLPCGYSLANTLVFKKVRIKLGLDRCRFCFTGAAPITMDTLNFFGALGIPVDEVYGMSECAGPTTLGVPTARKFGSCGKIIPGCEMKLDHQKGRDKEGEGEICYRGRHIMLGYMNNAKKTQEAIDEDGWLHSGDIGRMDKDGFYYITGRIKELIITQGGENIAPVPVEDALKKELPAISNCMMVGDRRKYCIMLVTLKTTPKADGTYTNTLAAEAAEVSTAQTIEEAKNDELWTKYLEEGRCRANEKSVSRASKVQKIAILPTEFSIDGGELGPTLKLKRYSVMEKYKTIIDDLYQ